MNDMANLALSFDNKDQVKLSHVPGPEGVRGRNSDNTKIKEVLGWAPATPLKVGLRKTYDWIKKELTEIQSKGDKTDFTKSSIVKQTTQSLDQLATLVMDAQAVIG